MVCIKIKFHPSLHLTFCVLIGASDDEEDRRPPNKTVVFIQQYCYPKKKEENLKDLLEDAKNEDIKKHGK